MGMKCNFIVASHGDAAARLRDLPPLDVAASDALATEILGKRARGRRRRAHRTGDLGDDVYSRDGEIAVGVYGDLTIAAFGGAAGWIGEAIDDWGWNLIRTHGVDAFLLHSVVGLGGFARWRNGSLVRTFCGSADDGLIDEDGDPLPFERDHDGEDDDFESITELAIRDRLGFCYEGAYYPEDLDPATVPLLVYR
ncbi:DUF6928 family protein [Tsukamurella hominis]|uniref:DUF6928 family protein n=1 Tax=Tsukamurella hominis TaxID=1970232 RepID=UPI0039EA9EB0